MLMSDSINEIAAALAKAQGEMDVAQKTKTNPFFKSKYANFTEIVNASRGALSNHQLSVLQGTEFEDGVKFLETMIMHSSGQWIKCRMPITPPKNDIQSNGSYITYLKRYCYAAMVGVVTIDDDGERAMAHSRKIQPDEQPEVDAFISRDQLGQLESELKNELELAKEILKKMGLKSLSQMPKSAFLNSIKRIREIKAIKKS